MKFWTSGCKREMDVRGTEVRARLDMSYEDHRSRLADAVAQGFIYSVHMACGAEELFRRMFPNDTQRRRMKRMQRPAKRECPAELREWQYGLNRRGYRLRSDTIPMQYARHVSSNEAMVSRQYFTHVLPSFFEG